MGQGCDRGNRRRSPAGSPAIIRHGHSQETRVGTPRSAGGPILLSLSPRPGAGPRRRVRRTRVQRHRDDAWRDRVPRWLVRLLPRQSLEPGREPRPLAGRTRALSRRGRPLPSGVRAALAGLVLGRPDDSRERLRHRQSGAQPRVRDPAHQGRGVRQVPRGNRSASQRGHGVPGRSHPCVPDTRQRDAVSRYVGRSAVQAGLPSVGRRGAAAGEPRGGHPEAHGVAPDGALARPDVRSGHVPRRGRADGPGPRPGRRPPLRLRGAADLRRAAV